MLRLSPKHRHYRTEVKELTFTPFLFSIKELFESKNFNRIVQYEPFFGPACAIRSKGQFRHLVKTENVTKHPLIFEVRHILVKLCVSDDHYR